MHERSEEGTSKARDRARVGGRRAHMRESLQGGGERSARRAISCSSCGKREEEAAQGHCSLSPGLRAVWHRAGQGRELEAEGSEMRGPGEGSGGAVG